VLVSTGPVFPCAHRNVRRVEEQPRALPHYQRPAHFCLQFSGTDHRHHYESLRDLPCAQQLVHDWVCAKSVCYYDSLKYFKCVIFYVYLDRILMVSYYSIYHLF
jgi:hypothetical protein